MADEKICPICGRVLGERHISKHHLIPKSRGGTHGPTVDLHHICHQKIHSLFTEKELAENYSTVEKIRAHEDVQKFVKWVRKKAPEFYQRNRRKKR